MKGVAKSTPPPLSAIKVPGARRVYLARGHDGFGFRLSTNSKTLDSGYSHYASEVDDGGLAEVAGLKVGDRFLEIDGRTVVNIPHNYIKAVFGKAVVNSRPLRCVVCPPNESILAAIRAKSKSDPEDNPPFQAQAPPSRPPLRLDGPHPRDAHKDGCHIILVLADGTELSIDAAEVDFGGQLPDDGIMLELFHDPTNPTASRPTRGGDSKAVIVLLEEGSAVSQAMQCEAAGASACVLVNRKADQKPRALGAGHYDGDRVSIPCVNISMRDGISLAKRLRGGQFGATVHPMRAMAYDESDIGTQISETRSEAEDEMNPGVHVEIDGRDCGYMDAGEAAFGNYLPEDGLKVEVVMPDDVKAASKFSSSEEQRAKGRAVLVERGGLKIAQKVLHCEEAGAQACIVANTTVGGQAFSIARTEDGGPEDRVSIPTLAIGTEDGQTIAEAVARGQTVVLTLYHYMPAGEEEELPDGWVAEEQHNGSVVYTNVHSGESLEKYPTPEAIALMRLEKRQNELEARERELAEERAAAAALAAAETERLAALREEQERFLREREEELAAREQSAQQQLLEQQAALAREAQHDQEREEAEARERAAAEARERDQQALEERELERERERLQAAEDARQRELEAEQAREAEEQAEREADEARRQELEEKSLREAEEQAEREAESARQLELEEAERAAAEEARLAAEEAELAVQEQERQEMEAIAAAVATTSLGRSMNEDVEDVRAFLAADHSPEAKRNRREEEYARTHDANGLLIAYSKYSKWHVIRCNLWKVRLLARRPSGVNLNDSSELGQNPLRQKARRTTDIVEHITDVLAETRDKAKRDKRPSEVKIASLKARVAQSHQRLAVSELNFEQPDRETSAADEEMNDAIDILDSMADSNPFLAASTPEPASKRNSNPFLMEAEPETTAAVGVAAVGAVAVAGVLGDGDEDDGLLKVRLVKQPGEKWGLQMKQTESGIALKGTPPPESPAGSLGLLEKGMVVVSVNDVNTEQMTKKEIAPHMSPDVIVLELRRSEDSDAIAAAAAAAATAERDERERVAAEAEEREEAARLAELAAIAAAEAEQGIIVVTIRKQEGLKLGLKIGNKEGTNAVKKVINGGLASETEIRAGMVVVSVNGQPCQGLSKDECVGLLSGTGTLEIKLRRMTEEEFQLFGAQTEPAAPGTSAAASGVIPVGVEPKPDWLHGKLEKEECEVLLLKKGGSDGRFLVRERQSGDGPVTYGLAVTYRGKATHHKIKADADGRLVLGNFTPYPKEEGSTSIAELIEFLGSINPPDAKAPGWPVKLIRGVRADGSLMAEQWTRNSRADETADALGRAAPGRAEVEAKYASMKRLAMLKECRAKGIDASAVSKDEAALRRLLVENDLAAAGIGATGTPDRLPGSILKTKFTPPRRKGSIIWKSDDEIVEVETIPRARNGDDEHDQYALYQCRYAYNSSIEGFTEGDDLAIEPGDILQVFDEGGTGGLPQTPEEKEADPNCWMRGWTQDEREGSFPSSYVSKIIPRGPVQMESYGS